MRNNNERQTFVQDFRNWETVGILNNLIRLKVLTYKKHEWYSVEIRQAYQHFDGRLKKIVWDADWNRIGFFKIDDSLRAFTYGFTMKDIVDEIKRIDKEEKKDASVTK